MLDSLACSAYLVQPAYLPICAVWVGAWVGGYHSRPPALCPSPYPLPHCALHRSPSLAQLAYRALAYLPGCAPAPAWPSLPGLAWLAYACLAWHSPVGL